MKTLPLIPGDPHSTQRAALRRIPGLVVLEPGSENAHAQEAALIPNAAILFASYECAVQLQAAESQSEYRFRCSGLPAETSYGPQIAMDLEISLGVPAVYDDGWITVRLEAKQPRAPPPVPAPTVEQLSCPEFRSCGLACICF